MAHLTELDWARLSSGASSPLRVRWHLFTCRRCRVRRGALRRERDAFLCSDDANAVLGELLSRVPATAASATAASERRTSPAPRMLQSAAWGVSFASCAVVLAVLVGRLTAPEQAISGALRPKGSYAWMLHLERDGRTEGFVKGRCRPGDRIRGQYRTAGPAHLFVLGMDSKGLVQQLFPVEPQARSASIAPGQGLLPEAWMLDESEGTQKFIAVFSPNPLSFSELKAKLGPTFEDGRQLPAGSVIRVAECAVLP